MAWLHGFEAVFPFMGSILKEKHNIAWDGQMHGSLEHRAWVGFVYGHMAFRVWVLGSGLLLKETAEHCMAWPHGFQALGFLWAM